MYPFASLMTLIATSHFNLLIPKAELQTIGPFSSGDVGKMALLPTPHHQGLWPPRVTPPHDAHIATDGEDIAGPRGGGIVA